MGKSITYNGHNGIAPPYKCELPTPPIPREKVKPEKAALAEKAQESIDDAFLSILQREDG